MFAAAGEIAVALSLVPILVSLGVDSGEKLPQPIGDIHPLVLLGFFILAASLRSAGNWLSSVETERNAQEFIVLLQSRLYRSLAGSHWDTIRRIAPPHITSALQTQTYDAAYGLSSLVQVITATLLIAGYLISAISIAPLLVPVMVFLLVLMWIVNTRHSSRVHNLSEGYVGATIELHQRYEDWVAINRISSLGVDTENLADRFESDARQAASHVVEYTRSSAATRATYEAALVAGSAIGIPYIWWLETPPAILAFGLLALFRVLPRAGSIQTGYQDIVNTVAPLQVIERLSARLEASPAASKVDSRPLSWNRIELLGVDVKSTFRDSSHAFILQGVHLELDRGQRLALMGPTGAGKTTLAEVMLMLIRPDAGEMLVDGRKLDHALEGQWRNQAAYVPQDVVLVDASIRENLQLYVPDATDDELEDALRSAAADFVMTRLPEGLDTRAGPGGRWLSGGERQRIGIARALLRKPGFLVLDEPTAALDRDTQTKLMDALGKLDHSMSVVLITHRHELLELADQVIEIEDGKIVSNTDEVSRP